LISAEFKDTLPFRGLTIGTGIHLEAKTVALLLTLPDGGARLVGMLLTGIAVRMAAREYAPSAASAYIEANDDPQDYLESPCRAGAKCATAACGSPWR
jgi:hypothetical protein